MKLIKPEDLPFYEPSPEQMAFDWAERSELERMRGNCIEVHVGF